MCKVKKIRRFAELLSDLKENEEIRTLLVGRQNKTKQNKTKQKRLEGSHIGLREAQLVSNRRDLLRVTFSDQQDQPQLEQKIGTSCFLNVSGNHKNTPREGKFKARSFSL